MEDSNFLQLAPFVASLVETLVRDGKIGIMSGSVRVSDINTGCAFMSSERKCSDRFKLHLNYAGRQLLWETIFNCNCPSEPPDFIFLTDEQSFQPDIAELQTLCNWNAEDRTSLTHAITELLESYKRHNLSLLASSPLLSDYHTLIECQTYRCLPEDVEVHVSLKNGAVSGPVFFMIRLRVDLTALPDSLTKGYCTEGIALLIVTYPSIDGGRVTPRMQLALHLEQLLALYGVRLNTLSFPPEGHLVDYVLMFRAHLQKMIENIANAQKLKEDFVTAFIALFGSAAVEYNTTDFNRISFLFVWHDFTFLVVINLSLKFPQEPPSISFQSVYHTRLDGSRYFITYSDQPYSPRWNGAEMAKRTRIFILERIQEFQRLSVREGISF